MTNVLQDFYQPLTIIGALFLFATLGVGCLVVGARLWMRWPVHAKAEMLTWDAVPPLVRPVLAQTRADLASLGFELELVTRSQRGSVGRNSRWWYRLALFNRLAGDGASLGWWELLPSQGGSPAHLSAVWLQFFRYTRPGGYAALGRRVAHAGRVDKGRWAYDLLADGVSTAAHYEAFKHEVGAAAARPFPFSTPSELVSTIEADSDRQMRAALAEIARVDRTGTWYVPTWRFATRAVVNELRGRGRSVPADRGFPVEVGKVGTDAVVTAGGSPTVDDRSRA